MYVWLYLLFLFCLLLGLVSDDKNFHMILENYANMRHLSKCVQEWGPQKNGGPIGLNRTYRLKTFAEYQRLFERVKECRFQIDQLEFDEEIEWSSKIMKLEQERDLDQMEWYDSEWDDLWAHTFSENGHLPVIWN